MYRAPRDGEPSYQMKHHSVDDLIPDYSGTQITPGEQLCVNRCVSKMSYVKDIIDAKIGDHVELPPILFNQNLP